jgi:hypothetical protein
MDILERLAFDLPHTTEDLKHIQKQKASDELAEKILSEVPRIQQTAKGRCLAVYDTFGQSGVYLGRKVFQRHDVGHCLFHISERKRQVASNHKRKPSLQRLVGIHNIESQ